MNAYSAGLLWVMLVCSLGCTTQRGEPTPIPVVNKEKDEYIEKVRGVVSESASALVAVSPVVQEGAARKLVENQVERLSGVSRPVQSKVDEYRRIIKTNDTKAADKDGEAAKKAEAEVTAQRRRADEAESALVIQELIAEQAEAEKVEAFKRETLWKYSMAGLGLFVAGVLAMAFTPFKKNAVVLIIGGLGGMSVTWLFESEWFPWVAGISVGLVAVSGVWIALTWAWNKVRSLRLATPLE